MKNSSQKIIPAALLLAASLSAQALTPGSGTWVKESATYGTPNLRDAYVYVPANANPQVLKGKRALMLTLHQCGGSATGVKNSFKWEQTAEKYGMVVVAPTAPFRFTNMGCWDILGTDHQNFNRDAGPLKKLIDSVKTRTNLDIDPDQIYVTGFSSGGGEAHILGCMAPGVFSAVGLVHAPPLGITSTQQPIQIPPPETIAANCRKYGSNADNTRQIMSIAFGGKDTLTTPAMARANIDAMKLVYGSNVQKSTTALPASSTMKEYADTNGRIRLSEIEIPGIAHTWPTASNSIDYPAIFTDWVFRNKAVNTPPTLQLNVGWVDPLMLPGQVGVDFMVIDSDGISNAFLEYQPIGEPVVPPVREEISIQGVSGRIIQLDSQRQHRFRLVATDKGRPQMTSELVKETQSRPPPFPGTPGKPETCGVTSTSICLQWKAADNAQYYSVGGTGLKATSTKDTTITFNDLEPDTEYSFWVQSWARYPGPQVSSDPIRTLPFCKDHSGNLSMHVKAGRAYTEGGTQVLSKQKVYAKGSKEYLGEICPTCISIALYVSVPLAETKPDYFIKGTCPK